MLKAKYLLAVLLSVGVLGAQAEFVDTPSSTSLKNENITTVERARRLADDTHVVLEGRITGRAGTPNTEEYFFEDATGSIKVEINSDVWRGQSVSPKNTVRLYGEVDQNHFNKTVEIEVKQLEVLK